MSDLRPIVTEYIELNNENELDDGLIKRTLIRQTDSVLRVVFQRNNTPVDITGATVVFNVQNSDGSWIRQFDSTIPTGTDGQADISITDTRLDNDGEFDGQIILTDPAENKIGWQRVSLTVYPLLGSTVTPPAGKPIDWSAFTAYTNTASHGPVRPDGTTLATASTNPDGSINLGVIGGLYDPAGSASTVQDNLDDHEANLANPHTVTKAQVGLGSADNTIDAGKPVSTAQQTALDLKQNILAEGAFVDGDKSKLDGVEALADVTDTANVTASGALMDSEVTNLADVKAFDPADYATSAQGDTADGAVQPGDDVATLGAGASTDGQVPTSDGAGGVDWEDPAQATAIGTVQDNLDDHEANLANPHTVTKAQVGLGSADNTSDANKPVSTAQQAAIDAAITALVGGAPGALDTLNELAAALDDDASFSTAVTSALSGKEPTLTTMTQGEAEAGASTAKRAVTAEVIKQAITALAPSPTFVIHDVTNAQRLAGTRSDDTTPLVAGDYVQVTDRDNAVMLALNADDFGVEANWATIAWTKDVFIQLAVSDETTDLTTGTAKVTLRSPHAFTLTGVRASVTTAPAGADLVVDVNEGGTSVLSTEISIDDGDKTSVGSATPPVISDSAIADDAEITVDIDQIGSGTAGAGLKITLIGTR